MSPSLCVIALLLAGCLAVPEIRSENDNVIVKVGAGKGVLVQRGDEAPRSIQDDIKAVEDKVDALETVPSELDTLTKSFNTAAAAQVLSSESLVRRADCAAEDRACATTDRAAIYDKILSAFQAIDNTNAAKVADLQRQLTIATEQAAAFSAALAAAPRTFIQAIDTDACASNARGCPMGSPLNITVFMEGNLAPSVSPYTCRFTAIDSREVFTTIPLIVTMILGRWAVVCPRPTFENKHFVMAVFDVNVEVLENSVAIPPLTPNWTPRIRFGTSGPLIAFAQMNPPIYPTLNNFVVRLPAIVSDPDTTDLSNVVLVSATSLSSSILASSNIKLVGTMAAQVIELTFSNTLPARSARQVPFGFTIVLKDDQGNTRTSTFSNVAFYFVNDLAINVNPEDTDQQWDSNFWLQLDLMVGDCTKDPLVFQKDMRCAGFQNGYLGRRVKLVGHTAGNVVSSAIYQVRPQFQTVSLFSLLRGDYGSNVVFADKDIQASSVAGLVQARLTTSNGQAGVERGDLFLDYSDSLMAHVTSWGNSQIQNIRLATNRNVSGAFGPHVNNNFGHLFAGVGGRHLHYSWCAAYDYAPITGYCELQNRYGARALFPGSFGGSCVNHPFNQCGGSKTNLPLQLAIYVDWVS